MFPSYMNEKHDIYYQQKHRRRARNDPHNRDYICPCGKSYLSYPALFTHIKQKHNGRAPGQIIKPKSENSGKRGRPRTKEVYDSESDTEDDAGNVIDNLCDYVTDIERKSPSELKKMYTSSSFYLVYASHNKDSEPKYNEDEDLYEDTCDHIFCEFLIEINKRQLQPSLFDELFVFTMLLTRALNEHFYEENKIEFIKRQTAKEIVDIVNYFVLDYLPKYIQELNLHQREFFQNRHIMKLLEYLFSWLLMKKYSGHQIRKNQLFVVE